MSMHAIGTWVGLDDAAQPGLAVTRESLLRLTPSANTAIIAGARMYFSCHIKPVDWFASFSRLLLLLLFLFI